MSPYDQLIRELREAEQRQPAPAGYDPAGYADSHRSFRKSLKDTARGLGKIVTPAAPKAPPVPTPSEIMSKALSAYREGRITGDQLAQLEARQHRLVDALATRGAK